MQMTNENIVGDSLYWTMNTALKEEIKEKAKHNMYSPPIHDHLADDNCIVQWKSREHYANFLISTDFVDTFQPEHQHGPDYVIPTENQTATEISEAVKLPLTMSDTIPHISVVTTLQQTVSQFPNHVALAVKRNNQWIEWTYTDYWTDVCTLAKGFIKLGLDRFNAVSILGYNAPEWAISMLAAIFAGGISTGIYTTNSPEACHHILEHSSSQIVVVENDLQLQKILKIRNRLANLKAIIQYTGEPTEIGVLSWTDVLEIGKSVSDDILDKRIKSLAVNQCCNLIYTSGTTGQPKGAMINHDNMLYIAKLSQSIAKFQPGKEIVLSYLPLSHVASQVSDIHASYSYGSAIYFANADALKGSLVDYIKDARPTYLVGVPRIWEKIVDKLNDAEKDLSNLKKKAFKWARNQAIHYHLTGQNGNNAQPLLLKLARKLVLRKIHKALGLQNVYMILSGGAPTSIEVLKYFASIDLKIVESYGMTESCGPNTLNCLYPYKIGSVGKMFPQMECKIDNPKRDGTGEVFMRGRHIFMGYLNQPDKTKEAFDNDRWLHTGDIGYFDGDNYLFITGRMKEIIITSGGENVAPIPIEDRVKKILPVISNCMLIGDNRKFLSIVLTLKVEFNMNTLEPTENLLPEVQKWCQTIGSHAKTVPDILQGPDAKVMRAIQSGVDKVNDEAISNAQKIQKWILLPKDFCIPFGEFGPTMKLQRSCILSKYKNEIESMYA